MNNCNEPVSVPANIENYIAVDSIRVLENLPHFRKISPSRRLYNLIPCPNLFGRIPILLFSFNQVLFGYDMHKDSKQFLHTSGPQHKDTLQNAKYQAKTLHFVKPPSQLRYPKSNGRVQAGVHTFKQLWQPLVSAVSELTNGDTISAGRIGELLRT
jgi:hypothetical protein